jgi:hypothetical protein
MIVKELTSKFLEKVIEEVKKEENMTKIKKELMDPLIHYTYKRIYPYFLITIVIFLLTFLLALLIFIMLVKKILKSD